MKLNDYNILEIPYGKAYFCSDPDKSEYYIFINDYTKKISIRQNSASTWADDLRIKKCKTTREAEVALRFLLL